LLPSPRECFPKSPPKPVSLTPTLLTRTLSTFTSTVSARSQATRRRLSCLPTGHHTQCPPLYNRRTQLFPFTSILLALTETKVTILSNTQPSHGGPLEEPGSFQIFRRFPALSLSLSPSPYSCTARSSSGSSTCLSLQISSSFIFIQN
jgi:hypothetical protein